MRRLKLLIITALFPLFSFAQAGFEIVPFAGYMFGGSVNFYEGKLKISNGLDYGVSLIIPIREVVDIEINYTGMQGDAKFTSYQANQNIEDDTTSMSTNYFQIGVLKTLSLNNHKIKPFGSFSAGATLFSLDDYYDTWRFSITAGLGVTYMFTDHIGIMLRGRFMMPIYFGGAGGYCGVGTGGSGCGLSVNGYAQPLQGDFTGGIVIKVGGNK